MKKTRHAAISMSRKTKKTHYKIGPRVIIFFIVLLVVTATIASVYTANIEKRERPQAGSQNNAG